MVFIVEFADGTNDQLQAGSPQDARLQAVAKFREKLVVSIRSAGLLGMSYRQPPPMQPRKF